MKHLLFALCTGFFLVFTNLSAQDSTTTSPVKSGSSFIENVNIMFYVDAYYGYDFNDPYSGYRTPLVYNYGRHDEFNINVALANFNYTSEKVEANFGLNVGSFPNAYYTGADTLYKYLYQANIKYKFSKKFDIAAGMFAPHLGFESIMSYDNMTVSHSLASEGTPYYIAGVKSYYHFNDNVELGLVVANGWQNLQRAPGTNQKGFGLHAHFIKENNFEFSFVNYTYNDDSDTTDWNFYNEIYIQKYLGEKFRVLGGLSYAFVPNDETVTIATLIAQYKISDIWAVAARAEHIQDDSRAYYTIDQPTEKISVSAFSANLDYQPVDRFKFRIEGRYFIGAEDTFRDDNNFDPAVGNIDYVNNAANILLTAQVKID